MEFTLKTSGYFYRDDHERKALEELGFTFSLNPLGEFVSDGSSPTIEINSLEELIQFSNRFGHLIVSDGLIEIYDNYRE